MEIRGSASQNSPRHSWINRLARCVLVVSVLLYSIHAPASTVWELRIESGIGPGSAGYFISTLEDAQKNDVDLLVLTLDTPGGLDQSMRDMIKAILDSKVPVATYVSPNGSRAASAGTYIMYASHIAAMAPATNIGSSTPVSLGGPPPSLPLPGQGDQGDQADTQDSKEDGPANSATAMEKKVLNDAIAYIRGLALLRGRNTEWAEATVREASNLTATDALKLNVIDIIATDLQDLLVQIQGRQIEIGGSDVQLNLSNITIEVKLPDWRDRFLSTITNPNIAYILLMIGMYGLILEFYNPGMGLPGVVGVICLLVAAFALQMLPINYTGLALILLGIALMVVEAVSPSFGIFGLGGVASFVLGSIMLMDTTLPYYKISLPLIAAMTTASAAVFLFTLAFALRARNRPVCAGTESFPGKTATVLEDFEHSGMVRFEGELWRAESNHPQKKDSIVYIHSRRGLILKITDDQPPLSTSQET